VVAQAADLAIGVIAGACPHPFVFACSGVRLKIESGAPSNNNESHETPQTLQFRSRAKDVE